MGDKEVVKAILGVYLADLPSDTQKLRTAVLSADLPAAQKAAHRLRGASANISALALREVASTMEAVAKAGDVERLNQLLTELDAQVARLMDCLIKEWGIEPRSLPLSS